MSSPNLLFVFADQLRGSDLGCAGNPDVRTPALDAFAAEGVRFTHHYATSPVCGPNRAVLLTGRYPISNRVVGNDLPLPPEIPSLGSTLKAHGYSTGYIGKWHLDGVPRSCWTPPGPRRHGFDFWAAYNCTHDYLHPRYYRDTPDVIEVDGYEPAVQTDLALEFLAAQNPDTPFALVLSWGPPHDPYDAVPEEYRAKYDPAALTLRPNVRPNVDNPLRGGRDCRRSIADYYAQITALDEQFARLLRWLEESGQADNTIVVFTSDHGDMLWSHGLMQKQLPHEESVNVPLLVRWPPGLAPGVSDTLIGTVDLMPTLLGMMGCAVPEGTQGLDLSTEVLCTEALLPRSVFLANYIVSDQAVVQKVPEWRAVRTARHTYVESPGRVPGFLFDNLQDPFQQQNLVGTEPCRLLQQELRVELGEWLARTGDSFSRSPELIQELGLEELWQLRQEESARGWKKQAPGE